MKLIFLSLSLLMIGVGEVFSDQSVSQGKLFFSEFRSHNVQHFNVNGLSVEYEDYTRKASTDPWQLSAKATICYSKTAAGCYYFVGNRWMSTVISNPSTTELWEYGVQFDDPNPEGNFSFSFTQDHRLTTDEGKTWEDVFPNLSAASSIASLGQWVEMTFLNTKNLQEKIKARLVKESP